MHGKEERVQQRGGQQYPFALILAISVFALLAGYLIAVLIGRGVLTDQRQAVLGATDELTPTAESRISTPTPTTQPAPTPTFVPIVVEQLPSAIPPTEAVPTETLPIEAVPTEAIATSLPAATTVPPTQPPPTSVPQQAGAGSIRLDDTAWQGGFRNQAGYRGRSATWIYGRNTQYNTMQAAFVLDTQPVGEATLSIEGMDSEGRDKTLIRIVINNVEIYNGPNLLPDDEYPYQVGTWATATWRFDGSVLQPGQNIIQISNVGPGEFSLPPFFMLDYAVVSFTAP